MSRMRPIRRLLLPLVLITACGKRPELPDRGTVCSEFFASFFAGSYLETLVLQRRSSVSFVDRRTSEPERWELFRKGLPSLQRRTYDDFWKQNSSPSELALNKAANLRVQLLSEQQWASMDAGNPVVVWESLRERFKEPVVGYLSVPGLNENGTQALLYFRYKLAPLAGEESYYLMVRVSGEWAIEDKWVTSVE